MKNKRKKQRKISEAVRARKGGIKSKKINLIKLFTSAEHRTSELNSIK